MSEDRSLSEFATDRDDEVHETDGMDVETEETGERGEDPDEAKAEVGESDETVSEIEPASATYAWTPGGVACANCGESVERRWRDEDGMVCVDCKEW
ncbi:DUF7573 domain-containing protein [Haladaptatus sp. NG-WS-4]